jgi:hypothetical protein
MNGTKRMFVSDLFADTIHEVRLDHMVKPRLEHMHNVLSTRPKARGKLDGSVRWMFFPVGTQEELTTDETEMLLDQENSCFRK